MKAWTINTNLIQEGYFMDPPIVYSDTIGKAKSEILKKIKHDGWTLYNGNDLTFLNLPVVRKESHDKKLVDGEWFTPKEIDKKKRLARLDSIMSNESITHCYIMKRGEYYRPNSCGYTSFQAFAGVYSKDEAVADGRSCADLYIVPIDNKEHNEMINGYIEELKLRLITLEPCTTTTS